MRSHVTNLLRVCHQYEQIFRIVNSGNVDRQVSPDAVGGESKPAAHRSRGFVESTTPDRRVNGIRLWEDIGGRKRRALKQPMEDIAAVRRVIGIDPINKQLPPTQSRIADSTERAGNAIAETGDPFD